MIRLLIFSPGISPCSSGVSMKVSVRVVMKEPSKELLPAISMETLDIGFSRRNSKTGDSVLPLFTGDIKRLLVSTN